MIKKALIFFLLIFPVLSNSQEYVDLINVSYAKSGETKFSNSPEKTTVSIFDSKVLLPIVINPKTAIITGFDFNIKNLQLFPNAEFSDLYYTRLKLGVNTEHSDKWTGSYALLPVISSDYKKLSFDDVYMGGIVIMTYKKNKSLNYKFGVYTGTQASGYFITALVGMYYKIPNSNFEITALMPGILDVNYGISSSTKVGIDYKGSSEAFKFHDENILKTCVENSTLEFSSYIENNSLTKNLLFRLKAGLATNKYDVYAVNDKFNLNITPIKIGDDRTKLNQKMNSSLFFRFEAIYRFNLNSK